MFILKNVKIFLCQVYCEFLYQFYLYIFITKIFLIFILIIYFIIYKLKNFYLFHFEFND